MGSKENKKGWRGSTGSAGCEGSEGNKDRGKGSVRRGRRCRAGEAVIGKVGKREGSRLSPIPCPINRVTQSSGLILLQLSSIINNLRRVEKVKCRHQVLSLWALTHIVRLNM